MKRSLGLVLVGLAGILIAGCPIYPHDDYCYDSYDCSADSYCSKDNVCVANPGTGGSAGSTFDASTSCSKPYQCGDNSVCGADGMCHTGTCHYNGCVSGYECVKDGDYYVCVVPTVDSGKPDQSVADASDSGTDATPQDSSADAQPPTYCANPSDCGPGKVCTPSGVCTFGSCDALGCVAGYNCKDANCQPSNPSSCANDTDCSKVGIDYTCVATSQGGICTPPSGQCTDKTQCPSATLQSCVDGKCITSCTSSAQCAEGYQCTPSLGVCDKPTKPCVVTNDCASAIQACVDGACVPKCADSKCPGGLVCVGNGCVPDQKPKFVCETDGQQDKCASSSVCLHHSCYIACTTPPDSCGANAPGFNVCKQVSISNGSVKVCGSDTNLGSECDPTAGTKCPNAKVCIDGFCR